MVGHNKTKHTLGISMEENRVGRLILRPPLDEQAYDLGAQVLRLTPDLDWLNPDERVDSDEDATIYRLVVDSERHLNGRANCLFDGLQKASVIVEPDETVRWR
ncbi:MAG TPA: hypothetical protein VFH99_01250 [Candidatus Saccharimonadales bacterium]|nr:hypothetical protein [Candidatus Saccharimonadales bacterium]